MPSGTEGVRSLELETQLLATIIRYPEEYFTISPYISNKDFTTNLHKAIYHGVAKLAEKDQIDTVLLAEQMTSSGLNFSEDLSDLALGDFLDALSSRATKKNTAKDLARKLATKTVAREKYRTIFTLASNIKSGKYEDIDGLIRMCDTALFDTKDYLFGQNLDPENIFKDMERIVEERGNHPVDDTGLCGPHPRMQEYYGSLVDTGNVVCLTARTGSFKTTFLVDYSIKVAAKYNVPILHLDNGEMTTQQVLFRTCSSLSGVPTYYLKTGKWRRNEEMIKKVRAVWPKVKDIQFYFFNVGGKSTEQIFSIIQKFYFTKVGRGQINKMICNLDYIKVGMEKDNKRADYLLVGEFMIKLKNFVTNVCPISVLTAVQANRSAVVGNKEASKIADDDGAVSLSDMITHNCTHSFILRRKTLDELAEEEGPKRFGAHKLIYLKGRDLGEKYEVAEQLIKMPDGRYLKNWINFSINNFNVEEKGTGLSVRTYLQGKLDGKETVENIEI